MPNLGTINSGTSVALTSDLSTGVTIFDGSVEGELVVGKIFEIASPGAFTLSEFRISTDTLPTGANIIVTVSKNGTVDGTATIATTDTATNGLYQATDTTFTSGSYVATDRVSVEITQAGSTLAGTNLSWALS